MSVKFGFHRLSLKSVGLASFMCLTACASIPPGAEAVNNTVSTGIERLSADTMAILDAYRQSLKLAVQGEFSRIHAAAEAAVRKKRGVVVGASLNDDQRQEVSAIVLIVFEKSYKLIDEKIDNARLIYGKNAKIIKGANDDITRLLVSAGRIGLAQSEIIETVKGLVPLPDVSGIVDEAVKLTKNI